ncbi:hypothetical protein DPPLL_18110 [Desulfofustis limnaeus]|jgi:glycosyltransferase involved in cell wall biosynthesis|uniref:Glycosyltransferase 2-like domain-containing protein n=2 Tax=Desulfofustis limnaeus TaxID=2740163 RepID=A0ABM7W935_9BACT|nr:hypothetical protein DPPLL_18110 [Desulfofustis limnaeus]
MASTSIMPKVSVVIPCYNQGAFLDEAVDSVLAQTCTDLEIIVVNDGSTDTATNRTLLRYDREKTRVLSTSNQGLAAARNNGIAAARGEYILPLDADDRIEPRYLEEAVAVLDQQPEVGIVYCRARLFGAVDADWLLPDYSLAEMLLDNVIFCTALFRRVDWQAVGGYDPGMIHGWEDYEFWLALLERGRHVRRLPGRYFHYRVSPDSMVRSKEKRQKVEMFARIYQRHASFIGEHIDIWISRLLEKEESYITARLYVDCGQGLSDESSVARKVNVGRQTLTFPVDAFAQRREFRFDPADCPAVVSIESIDFVTTEGRTALEPLQISSNALFCRDNRFFFCTEDPQVYFALAAADAGAVVTVVVSYELVAVGESALQMIISSQEQQLRECLKNPFASIGRLLRKKDRVG